LSLKVKAKTICDIVSPPEDISVDARGNNFDPGRIGLGIAPGRKQRVIVDPISWARLLEEFLVMTRHIVKRLTAIGLVVLAAAPAAAGDPVAGQKKAEVCASCHGANGISQASNFPIIAGQYSDYIERVLKDYRSGERDNAVMKGFAANLSDTDISDLAAWFSSQEGLPDLPYLSVLRRLRVMQPKTCGGCHGVPGTRNAYPGYRVPKVRGQHAQYLIDAITAYRQGTRVHPTMRAQVAHLTDQQIVELAGVLSRINTP
jgi:cytochrome c553